VQRNRKFFTPLLSNSKFISFVPSIYPRSVISIVILSCITFTFFFKKIDEHLLGVISEIIDSTSFEFD